MNDNGSDFFIFENVYLIWNYSSNNWETRVISGQIQSQLFLHPL